MWWLVVLLLCGLILDIIVKSISTSASRRTDDLTNGHVWRARVEALPQSMGRGDLFITPQREEITCQRKLQNITRRQQNI